MHPILVSKSAEYNRMSNIYNKGLEYYKKMDKQDSIINENTFDHLDPQGLEHQPNIFQNSIVYVPLPSSQNGPLNNIRDSSERDPLNFIHLRSYEVETEYNYLDKNENSHISYENLHLRNPRSFLGRRDQVFSKRNKLGLDR
ncbi:hypothetical protein AYI68_g5739 [Smittium mucronatum]|uniref:Uncharacterized protein n=1 Tax=Smittium mucronatum TaxID=133383 RepID=A0A1R0GTK0_9FUNG|nr:hypothetical protein AYI68_g5739 [Smittium mucronatum]